ncbi:MAG TPA: hypothetical protein V6C57_23625 [Coleofasciculaceae cyanobacterium]
MEEIIGGEVLELRNGEILTFFGSIGDAENIAKANRSPWYAVRLLPTPAFPNGILPCPDSYGFALICARLFSDGWGWVNLSPDLKQQIGEVLKNEYHQFSADPIEQWVYVVVSMGEPIAQLPQEII